MCDVTKEYIFIQAYKQKKFYCAHILGLGTTVKIQKSHWAEFLEQLNEHIEPIKELTKKSEAIGIEIQFEPTYIFGQCLNSDIMELNDKEKEILHKQIKA